jgi:hypothetical protein
MERTPEQIREDMTAVEMQLETPEGGMYERALQNHLEALWDELERITNR